MLKVKTLEDKIKSRIKKTRLSSKVQMFNFRGREGRGGPVPLPAPGSTLAKWSTRTVTQLLFQHDSELNMQMIITNIFFRKDDDQSIQYPGSTNLTSHASLTLLIQLRKREEVTSKIKKRVLQKILKASIKKKLGLWKHIFKI